MSEQNLLDLKKRRGVEPWRIRLAEWIESPRLQHFIVGVILINALILGLETDQHSFVTILTVLVGVPS